MRKQSIIKKLVVASIFFHLAFFLNPLLYGGFYSPESIGYIYDIPNKVNSFKISEGMAYFYLAIYLGSAVLLFFSVRYSGIVYACVVTVDVAIGCLYTLAVLTGIDLLFLSLLNLTDGAILMMCFWCCGGKDSEYQKCMSRVRPYI